MLEEVFNCENNSTDSTGQEVIKMYMAIYLLRFQGGKEKRFRQVNRILDELQFKLVFEGASASLHTSGLFGD